ncbi:MAG: TetR/AcrR family transcriptional regulator [Rhodocyclaceae bacterium]|nr:TetR/AcrR family transcriptional regulator [Rhodocyclaceae bacterium]
MPAPKKKSSPHATEPKPRGEAFVQTVLQVTLQQLADVGFEKLSIPDVAARAGVNRTSIYRRWRTKEVLVRHALDAAMDHSEGLATTGDLRTDLIALAQTVAHFLQSPTGTAVVRILLAEGSNPELRLLANKAYGNASDRAPFALLAQAKARGEIAPDVDASTLLFTIAGALMHRVFVEQGRATVTYIAQVVDLVLKGATRYAKEELLETHYRSAHAS